MKAGQWFLVAIGLLVGFWAGRYSAPQGRQDSPLPMVEEALPTASPSENPELRTFLAKLKGISPEEVREYLRTQNADEKLKRADEILGKIMAAMVADVGFKLSQADLDQFHKSEVVTTTLPHVPTTTLSTAEIAISPRETQDRQRENRELTNAIRSASTQEQAMAALASMTTNMSSSLSGSGMLNRQQIRELTGRFDGNITYDEPKSVVKATMWFNGKMIGEKLQGRSEVQIYDANGKVVSNGSSRGDLSGTYSGNGSTVFVEIGSAYIQMAYFPQMEMWMGNYLRSNKGSLTKVGTVVFQKR